MALIPRSPTSRLLVLTLVLLSKAASAQSLPDKKEVSDWVRNALKASDLASADSLSYHLMAKVHYTLGDKTLDGTYEILWATRDRYRLEIRMSDTGETDVVLTDKEYIVRNTPTPTVEMGRLTGFLFNPSLPESSGTQRNDSVYKLSSTGEGATRQICALVGDNQTLEHEFCFDANSELVSRHDRPRPHSSVSKEAYSLDMTDYVSLESMRYPRRLSKRFGPESIDVNVEKWETVKQFDAKVFVPPPNSTVWNWCSTPEVKTPKNAQQQVLSAILSQSFTANGRLPYLAVYQIIGTDGMAKQTTDLFSSPESAMKEFTSEQRRGPWPVHVCNGKPVEYESIFTFWPLLPKLR